MKYLVTLSPQGKFFFGGDRTFSSQERQSYYSHSTHFPQQTALLGMLRYALLREADALDKSATEKEKLIGASGFDPIIIDPSYGKIKRFSPVYIREGESAWLSAGFDHQEYGHLSVGTLPDGDVLTVLGYDPKKWLEHRFISAGDITNVKSRSYFFREISQVGNSRKVKQDAFFKQDHLDFVREDKSYRKRFAFAFELESTEPLNLSNTRTVFLGAESLFSIQFAPLQESIFEVIETENKRFAGIASTPKLKVTLLSDAYVSDLAKLKANSECIVTDGPVPFKFNRSKQSDYYRTPDRSEQYHLLSRGTVIYPKNLQACTQLLEDEKAFRSIGYNYFKIQTR